MLSGDPTALTVLTPEATLAGQSARVVSGSVTRDLGLTVPGVDTPQEAAASGEDVVLAPSAPVVVAGASPWRSGADLSVQPGTPVALTLSLAPGLSWPVLTGTVVAASGSTDRGEVTAQVVDAIDPLDVPLDWEGLHSTMSGLGPGAPFRHVGLCQAYVVDRAFRDGGYHATPPGHDAALDAPMSGSLWPRRGNVWSTGATPTISQREGMPQAACLVGTVSATYRLAYDDLGNHEIAWEVDRSSGQAGTVTWDVIDSSGTGKGYRLRYTQPSGALTVHRATVSGSTVVAGVQLVSTTVPAGSHRVCLRILRYAATDAREVSVRFSGTATEVRSTQLAGSYFLSPGAPVHATVTSTGSAAVGAFLIDRPPTAWATHGHTPQVSYGFTFGSINRLAATPRVRADTTALDIIRMAQEAEVAAFGFDESGVPFYRTRAWLTQRASSGTLTASSGQIIGFDWVQTDDNLRSSVVVRHRVPTRKASHYPSITVWQGSGGSIDPGEDTHTVIASPDADEDWIRVYSTPLVLGTWGPTTTEHRSWNRGHGSWAGGRGRADSGGSEVEFWPFSVSGPGVIAPGSELQVTTRVIAHDVIAVDHTVSSALNSRGEDAVVVMRSPSPASASAAYTQLRRGENLPLIRAYQHTRWTDMETPAAPAAGGRYRALVHDVGWMVQDTADITAIRDWLAASTATPRPRLAAARIKPDPRWQVGDRVRVVDDRPGGTGADVTGLVTGKRISVGPHEVEMVLSVMDLSTDPWAAQSEHERGPIATPTQPSRLETS